MTDVELFTEGRLRERELYFASPQFQARASWRKGLAAITRRPSRERLARRSEPKPVVVLY